MKTFAFALKLKDDQKKIEEYKELHRRVRPEVEASFRSLGIKTIRIFLLGRWLFQYVETEDHVELRRDFARHLANTKCREWEEFMMTFQEKLPEAGPDEWWAAMEQIYELT